MKLSTGTDISLFKQIANDKRTQAAFFKNMAESLERQAADIDHVIANDLAIPDGASAGPPGPPPDSLGQ